MLDLLAADEFILFGKVAQEVVGKAVMVLMRNDEFRARSSHYLLVIRV